MTLNGVMAVILRYGGGVLIPVTRVIRSHTVVNMCSRKLQRIGSQVIANDIPPLSRLSSLYGECWCSELATPITSAGER